MKIESVNIHQYVNKFLDNIDNFVIPYNNERHYSLPNYNLKPSGSVSKVKNKLQELFEVNIPDFKELPKTTQRKIIRETVGQWAVSYSPEVAWKAWRAMKAYHPLLGPPPEHRYYDDYSLIQLGRLTGACINAKIDPETTVLQYSNRTSPGDLLSAILNFVNHGTLPVSYTTSAISTTLYSLEDRLVQAYTILSPDHLIKTKEAQVKEDAFNQVLDEFLPEFAHVMTEAEKAHKDAIIEIKPPSHLKQRNIINGKPHLFIKPVKDPKTGRTVFTLVDKTLKD